MVTQTCGCAWAADAANNASTARAKQRKRRVMRGQTGRLERRGATIAPTAAEWRHKLVSRRGEPCNSLGTGEFPPLNNVPGGTYGEFQFRDVQARRSGDGRNGQEDRRASPRRLR